MLSEADKLFRDEVPKPPGAPRRQPQPAANALAADGSLDFAKFLAGVHKSEEQESEKSKFLTTVLKHNACPRPKPMIPIGKISEKRKKEIEGTFSALGMRGRTVQQYLLAEKYNQVLKKLRTLKGSGSRFLWNVDKWERTICVDDLTSGIPKTNDMETYLQIGLCEKVDFGLANIHNVPRNVIHSEQERNLLRNAFLDFKKGIHEAKFDWKLWQIWAIK